MFRSRRWPLPEKFNEAQLSPLHGADNRDHTGDHFQRNTLTTGFAVTSLPFATARVEPLALLPSKSFKSVGTKGIRYCEYSGRPPPSSRTFDSSIIGVF